ncbi:MAG: hypothetical protein ACFFDI_23270 [Promethearchaeota archaeon]
MMAPCRVPVLFWMGRLCLGMHYDHEWTSCPMLVANLGLSPEDI